MSLRMLALAAVGSGVVGTAAITPSAATHLYERLPAPEPRAAQAESSGGPLVAFGGGAGSEDLRSEQPRGAHPRAEERGPKGEGCDGHGRSGKGHEGHGRGHHKHKKHKGPPPHARGKGKGKKGKKGKKGGRR